MNNIIDTSLISWEEAVVWLKSQPDKQELVEACFFDDPLEQALERYYTSTEWIAIRSIIKNINRGKVLDIGAGRGIASYALAKDGWQVYALEPDTSNIVGSGAIKIIAKENKLPITVVETMGESLPFEENTFDLVFARQVLHHASDLNQMCKEVQRVLKPGGMFIAVREHVISKKSDLPKFLNKHPLNHLYGGENAFLLKEYISAIEESGLTMSLILKPYSSEINLYPLTKQSLQTKINSITKIPLPSFFINIFINVYERITNNPGRIYSFIAIKSIKSSGSTMIYTGLT